ncbi:MAG: OB-fold nucleic acid binding domain-containing protein, partial [Acidimicrobiales bacterium]
AAPASAAVAAAPASGEMKRSADTDDVKNRSDRRAQLWAAGPLALGTPDRLPGLVVGDDAPDLPEMSVLDEIDADLWATGVTVGPTIMELLRPRLDAMGVVPAAMLGDVADEPDDVGWAGASEGRGSAGGGNENGSGGGAGGNGGGRAGWKTGPRVLVAGVVTHRQRPESAGGAVFLNLEDETGLVNVICSQGAWTRWRRVARAAPALLVRGRLERVDDSIGVVAETFTRLDLGESGAQNLPPARNFR